MSPQKTKGIMAAVTTTVLSSVSVTITPVNDGPSVTVPNLQQINEDDSITFSNGVISVTDPDAAEVEDLLEVTVSALFGTLTLGTNDGSLVFTQDAQRVRPCPSRELRPTLTTPWMNWFTRLL